MTIKVYKKTDIAMGSLYVIELTVTELEFLRRSLADYGANRKADTDECMFSTKCATIISNALVFEGD